MARFAFPVIEGNPGQFPAEPVCPVCSSKRVFEPHDFVVLSGGSASESEATVGDGFLHMAVHPKEGEVGSRTAGAFLEIVEDTPTGQFDLYFCSTPCLRSFLNTCVDELEARLAEGERSG